MKRFEVLYCNGKCSIREMPGEFKLDPDGYESRLAPAVGDYFNCTAKPIVSAGVTTHVEVDLPDDYEVCGICGMDHAYDGSTPEGAHLIEVGHEERR